MRLHIPFSILLNSERNFGVSTFSSASKISLNAKVSTKVYRGFFGRTPTVSPYRSLTGKAFVLPTLEKTTRVTEIYSICIPCLREVPLDRLSSDALMIGNSIAMAASADRLAAFAAIRVESDNVTVNVPRMAVKMAIMKVEAAVISSLLDLTNGPTL